MAKKEKVKVEKTTNKFIFWNLIPTYLVLAVVVLLLGLAFNDTWSIVIIGSPIILVLSALTIFNLIRLGLLNLGKKPYLFALHLVLIWPAFFALLYFGFTTSALLFLI